MNAWPVIHRELRAEARHTFNYWLRLLGVSLLLSIFVMMMLDPQGSASKPGAKLFGNLNTALFIAIWLLVPLLTADCISRERREGTLGLLFLTPLTSRGVVVGKGLIHALRAATLLLATLPVLALPFLLGGVTWREGVMALLVNLSSVCLALAAGLIASSQCTQWNRALFLAEVLAAIFLLGFGGLFTFALLLQVAAPFVPGFTWRGVSFGEMITGAAILCTDVAGMWSEAFGSLPAAANRAWLQTVGEGTLVAIFASGLMVLRVARRLERTRQEQPPTARQLRWQRFFLAPLFWKSLFRSKMRRRLERNPVGWLQQRSAAARITKWGWCLFVIAVESSMAAEDNFVRYQLPLALCLILGLAASAAGSFSHERQSGALELILVTPLSVGQIIFGRLRGVWGQLLPALGTVAAVCLFVFQAGSFDLLWPGDDDPNNNPNSASALFLLSSFVTIPVVGFYFSLSRRHFMTAWLLTLAVGLVLPWLTLWGGRWFFFLMHLNPLTYRFGTGTALAWATVLQIVFGAATGGLLYRNLHCRRFVLVS